MEESARLLSGCNLRYDAQGVVSIMHSGFFQGHLGI